MDVNWWPSSHISWEHAPPSQVLLHEQQVPDQQLEQFILATNSEHFKYFDNDDHITQSSKEAYRNFEGVDSYGDQCGDLGRATSDPNGQHQLDHHEQQHEEALDTSDTLRRKRPKGESSRRRTSNWTEVQTGFLVECKKQAKLCKERGGWLGNSKYQSKDWDVISHKFSVKFAAEPDALKSSKQCRLRWDTLLKSFKKIEAYCKSRDKRHAELSKEELERLELPTLIREEWYETIDEFCPPRRKKSIQRKSDDACTENLGVVAFDPHASNILTPTSGIVPTSPPHVEL